VHRRPRALIALLIALLLAGPLLLGACGDDAEAPDTQTTTPATSIAPGTTVAGPTEGAAACADLADRYVQVARRLFATEGTPSDQLVDSSLARFEELDQIAGAAGCGPEYVDGVCQGLDELTADGLLVIYPLTTARCL
jgi:hypothetical protein